MTFLIFVDLPDPAIFSGKNGSVNQGDIRFKLLIFVLLPKSFLDAKHLSGQIYSSVVGGSIQAVQWKQFRSVIPGNNCYQTMKPGAPNQDVKPRAH